MTTTPGWYRDPVDPNSIRWWDGAQWTEQRPVPPMQPTGAQMPTPEIRKRSRLLVPIAVGVVSLLVGGVGGYLLGSRDDNSAASAPVAATEAPAPDTGDPTVPSAAELGIEGADDVAVLTMIRDAIPAMAPMDDDLIAEQADLICGALRGLPSGSTGGFAHGFASTSQLSESESYELIGFSIAWKCPEVS